jgi:hypothetical protein
MKIMVFTEGTLTMAKCGKGVSREERVEQVKQGLPDVDDFKTYVPVENAVDKLKTWMREGAAICYLTSRRDPAEVQLVKDTLNKYFFPDGEVYFCKVDEDYGDVALRVMPDALIEDDCESIGGEAEMTYPKLPAEERAQIKSIIVKEFEGIDNLPGDLNELTSL